MYIRLSHKNVHLAIIIPRERRRVVNVWEKVGRKNKSRLCARHVVEPELPNIQVKWI
jgi:hypothetical protein